MESTRHKLQEEQDVLPWSELARHFAFGRLFMVSDELNLVDAALAVAEDNTSSIRSWMERGQFKAPTEEEIESWTPKTNFKVNIISPFVIVQSIQTNHS